MPESPAGHHAPSGPTTGAGAPPTWLPAPHAPPLGQPAGPSDADRTNAIVLVVVSVIVAVGIVAIALLASADIGPDLDQLQQLERPRTAQHAELIPEATGGR